MGKDLLQRFDELGSVIVDAPGFAIPVEGNDTEITSAIW
jgi:hypothetical protein